MKVNWKVLGWKGILVDNKLKFDQHIIIIINETIKKKPNKLVGNGNWYDNTLNIILFQDYCHHDHGATFSNVT